MKMSCDVYEDEDLMTKWVEKKFVCFGFCKEYEKEKVDKNKKAIRCTMLSLQKAKMLRDFLSASIKLLEKEKDKE